MTAIKQSEEKICWIDMVRGGAILLVVIGHSGCPKLLYNFIYSFHMPLFFFISGYLYNYKKWNKTLGYRAFILNRFVSYIKPYFILCGVNLFLCLLEEIIKNGISTETVLLIGKWLYGIIYVYPSVDYMPNCTPLWFLVALFFANAIFYYILEIKHRVIQISVVIIIAIVDAVLASLWDYQMPWCFGAILIGVCCMYFGLCLKNGVLPLINFENKPIIIAVLLIIGIASGNMNGRVGIGANNLGQNPVLFWISALTLSFAIMLFAVGFKYKFSLLIWFGRNTILFMGFNYFFNDLPQTIWLNIMPFTQYPYTWYIKSIVCVLCISCTILLWSNIKKSVLIYLG